MLKVCLSVFLLFLVLSECYPQEQKSFITGPELGILGTEDPYTKDFGKIKASEIARHSFIIKNDSKKVLNIKSVNTSCGCTVSEVKNRRLDPQESTDLEVKFNSKGYHGPVQQFIYVNTDSLDNPILRFIIKADVVK